MTPDLQLDRTLTCGVGYSPLDFTLLDYHFGTIKAWRDAITEVHRRGMYVVLDNTLATVRSFVVPHIRALAYHL